MLGITTMRLQIKTKVKSPN